IGVNFIMYATQLLRVIYKEKIDVLDGRLLGGGIYGLIAKKVTRLPTIITLYHKSVLKSFGKRFFLNLLGTSDAVICDSKMRSDELKHWIDCQKPKYLVIPSAINLKYSEDKEVEQIIRDKALSGKLIIAQIAGVIPFKGQDLLLSAFYRIAQNHNNIELWIVGYPRDIDYYNSLIEQVQELNIADKVRFISYPGYIGNIFRAIDIQVHASRFDSLPNSILEGMSVGKPLIACEVGGIPELITHGETGLLFEVDNLAALINCIDKLINDTEYRSKLGMAAFERFEERYSPAFLIKQLEDAIIEITTTN
ncbi:MAG: glycosyltransferase family 1 protein, partial [Flavobacterium sp.]